MGSRIPDVVFELPAGWRWQQRRASPLGIQPESESGLLQISSPPSSSSWREAELDPLIRKFAIGAKLGDVVSVECGQIPYGRFVRAEMMSERFGDVASWIIVHDTHDTLLVTWLAESKAEDGKVVRELVKSLAPGPFSQAVDMLVSSARSSMASVGKVDDRSVFVNGGVVTAAYLGGRGAQVEREAIRAERKKLGATVAARISMAELGRGGAPQPAGSVYVESEELRKCFLVPASERGTVIVEASPEDAPITDFFVEPDPRVVEAVARGRVTSQ